MLIRGRITDILEYRAIQTAIKLSGMTEKQWVRKACLMEVVRLHEMMKQRQVEAKEQEAGNVDSSSSVETDSTGSVAAAEPANEKSSIVGAEISDKD